MAFIRAISAPVILSLLFLVLPDASNAQILKPCKFDSIYQLGDSLSDTGNDLVQNPSFFCGKLPYGESFSNHSTGRCSNGMLIIDFIAESAGIPFLDAYLNPNATFNRGRGVNFAVAGATALPVEVLARKGIIAQVTNSSLSVQLDWMFSFFNSICYNQNDCEEKLKSALFMVGEFGVNDYNFALLQSGKTAQEVKSMIPDVVKAIKDAVTRVIGYGGRRIIVPGNFPIGCLPIYLTNFQSKNASSYDPLNCINWLNEISMSHNDQLQQTIQELQKENPNVTIVYGDYYNAYFYLLQNPARLGFDPKSAQKACCGSGGDYNFSFSNICGIPGVPVCPNPDDHISWDGVHSTQNAYKLMMGWLLPQIFRQLQCS